MNSYIEHSAKGSTWTKRDHKYIRKEGNKYIYPEDLKPGNKKSSYAVAFKNQVDAKKNQIKQDISNTWKQNISDPINSINPLYKKKQQQAKIDEANARMERRERQLATVKRLDEKQKEADLKARGIKVLNPVEKQEAKKWMDSYVANNRRIIAEKKQKEANERIDRIRGQELLNQANNNRKRSSNPTGRTARETLSKRGVSRVAYGTSRTPNETATIRREMINKPQYDDRGFRKNSDISYNDTIVQRRSTGGAREALSRRGTRKVEYTGSGDNRRRVVTNKNYTKTSTEVDAKVGLKDARNAFSQTISNFNSKIGKGKSAIDKWRNEINKQGKAAAKEQRKLERQKEREKDKNLPANIRFKKNIKKGKKALAKFFSNFKGDK